MNSNRSSKKFFLHLNTADMPRFESNVDSLLVFVQLKSTAAINDSLSHSVITVALQQRDTSLSLLRRSLFSQVSGLFTDSAHWGPCYPLSTVIPVLLVMHHSKSAVRQVLDHPVTGWVFTARWSHRWALPIQTSSAITSLVSNSCNTLLDDSQHSHYQSAVVE